MKRIFLCAILIISMLCCVACNLDVAAHSCAHECQTCQKCMNNECIEDVCADKCTGHSEQAFTFSGGDYITDTAISIDTGTAVLDIEAGIYVRGDVVKKTEDTIAAIEKVTGLDFDGFGYARGQYPDGKVHITVSRDALYLNEDWYTGSVYSEVGSAYASASEHVYMSPGDLFIFWNYTIIHELSHVLMFRQQEWSHSQVLAEGFAEYTTYLVLNEIRKTDPTYVLDLGVPSVVISNMSADHDEMYKYPITHWFDNTFEHAGNGNYTIGFRFMAYLDAVYGDYSGWTLKFNELYPYDGTTLSDATTTEQQIAVLKATYGDDVLDGFYPWLKEHTDMFTEKFNERYDVRNANSVNWYPEFNAVDSRVCYFNLEYKDLYINLETAKYYLSEYKNCDISNIKLTASQAGAVNLYRADGSFTSVLLTEPVSLEGISYIKLVGEGFLNNLEIVDFVVNPG